MNILTHNIYTGLLWWQRLYFNVFRDLQTITFLFNSYHICFIIPLVLIAKWIDNIVSRHHLDRRGPNAYPWVVYGKIKTFQRSISMIGWHWFFDIFLTTSNLNFSLEFDFGFFFTLFFPSLSLRLCLVFSKSSNYFF